GPWRSRASPRARRRWWRALRRPRRGRRSCRGPCPCGVGRRGGAVVDERDLRQAHVGEEGARSGADGEQRVAVVEADGGDRAHFLAAAVGGHLDRAADQRERLARRLDGDQRIDALALLARELERGELREL